jgi:hypothetical protein
LKKLEISGQIVDVNCRSPTITNCFYLKSQYEKQKKFLYKNRLVTSIRNNEPVIVFDFRYLNKHRNKKRAADAIFESIYQILQLNREDNPVPFQIFFCNYDAQSIFHRKFSRILDYESNFVFTSPQSYTDLFSSDQLIYLSRDAEKKMHGYDSNKVHTIGCIYDDGTENFEFSSLHQASIDRIQSLSLPIESYLE